MLNELKDLETAKALLKKNGLNTAEVESKQKSLALALIKEDILKLSLIKDNTLIFEYQDIGKTIESKNTQAAFNIKPEDASKDITEDIEDTTKETSGDINEGLSEKIPEDISEDVPVSKDEKSFSPEMNAKDMTLAFGDVTLYNRETEEEELVLVTVSPMLLSKNSKGIMAILETDDEKLVNVSDEDINTLVFVTRTGDRFDVTGKVESTKDGIPTFEIDVKYSGPKQLRNIKTSVNVGSKSHLIYKDGQFEKHFLPNNLKDNDDRLMTGVFIKDNNKKESTTFLTNKAYIEDGIFKVPNINSIS